MKSGGQAFACCFTSFQVWKRPVKKKEFRNGEQIDRGPINYPEIKEQTNWYSGMQLLRQV